MSEPIDPTAATSAESRPLRQGLPPAYRMRHDAHYVDELESKRRPADASSPVLAFPTSIPVTFALRDMSEELEGVASCFNLVAMKARPLRERIGLALARVGVQRNMRAFQALRVLLEDPPPEPAPVSLNNIVEQTIKSFEEELRITESRVSLDLHDGPLPLDADARMLTVALQACVGTLMSLVEASGQGGTIHITTRTVERMTGCELRQDAYRMSADQFARLSDLEWSDRPGGIPAGISIAAAARVAQTHGGALDARRTDAGGCALILSLRSSRAATDHS